MNFEKEKQETAYFMRRLYERGLTTCSGGNVSQRIGDVILITASQTDKASIQDEQIAEIHINGDNLTPHLSPSMETTMHLSVYRMRDDVKAIVHAHPVTATAFATTNKKINCSLTGETRAIIGIPVNAPYALMGTEDLAKQVAEAAIKANVVLMENHGVICFGKNLLLAFDRMEVLEAAAKQTLITHLLGDKKEISSQDLNEIDHLFS
ncbi:MAG: class II aldolase/adducin family protein [Bacteroidales bacterium]